MNLFLYFLVAYLIGSIPTGSIAARLLGRESIFAPGEWGPRPAGEVFQILGRPVGLLVTVLDVLKGILVVGPLLNYFHGPTPLWQLPWWVVSIAGLLVVFGHCHSIWLGFKGGRGMTTSFGVVVFLLPIPALIAAFIWGGLSFWGLSTRPAIFFVSCVLPLLTIPWVWWNPEKMYLVYPVAFLCIWSMFEYRKSIQAYLGWNKPEPETVADPEKNADPPK